MKYTIIHSVCDVPVPAPAENLDLVSWVFGLSDKEYQACSKGHIAAGSSTHPDGTRTSVNVETVGGHLLVQHYVPEIAQPDHVKLVSQTDYWLIRVWPVRIKVIWEIKLIPATDGTCVFQNRVAAEHGRLIMKILPALVFARAFLKRHNAEETPLFVQNLLSKVAKIPGT